jgi:hypothetical protein
MVLIRKINTKSMSLSKLTKSFFNLHRKVKCSDCDDGVLEKQIEFTIAKPLDEEYVGLLFWEQCPTNRTFILRESVGEEGNEDIFLNQTPEISSLSTLKEVCLKLQRFGYYIDAVYLRTECSNFDCRFLHRLNLEWSEDTKSIFLESEHVDIKKLSLHHNYIMRCTTITVREKKNQVYDFKLLNLPISNYSRLEHKIKQILLIG